MRISVIKIFTIAIVIVTSVTITMAQNTDADFVISNIKLNYPGFKLKTSEKQFDSLVKSTFRFYKKDTFKALSMIVGSFKDPHLQLCVLGNVLKVDTQQCTRDLVLIKKKLSQVNLHNKEGFWLNEYNNCVIGIRSIGSNDRKLEAIVIENNSNKLIPGEMLAEMEKTGYNTYLTKFVSPRTGGAYYLKSVFRSDTVFTSGAESKWTKLSWYDPNVPLLPSLKRKSDSASGRLISESTYLITLPINSARNTKLIEGIIERDSEIVAKTRNLLIDIRGNIGGQSTTYVPLVPFIYTRPIQWVGADMYATSDGIARYKKNIDKKRSAGSLTDEQEQYYRKDIANLENNIGGFVLSDLDTLILDEIKTFPIHVGVIIDYACQSAAEMLILTFKQSGKVLTFGEKTMGAVDYLDFYPIPTPTNKYVLYMPTTKRKIEKGGELDGKGIEPDISISISESNWVEYVAKYLDDL